MSQPSGVNSYFLHISMSFSNPETGMILVAINIGFYHFENGVG